MLKNIIRCDSCDGEMQFLDHFVEMSRLRPSLLQPLCCQEEEEVISMAVREKPAASLELTL